MIQIPVAGELDLVPPQPEALGNPFFGGGIGGFTNQYKAPNWVTSTKRFTVNFALTGGSHVFTFDLPSIITTDPVGGPVNAGTLPIIAAGGFQVSDGIDDGMATFTFFGNFGLQCVQNSDDTLWYMLMGTPGNVINAADDMGMWAVSDSSGAFGGNVVGTINWMDALSQPLYGFGSGASGTVTLTATDWW